VYPIDFNHELCVTLRMLAGFAFPPSVKAAARHLY